MLYVYIGHGIFSYMVYQISVVFANVFQFNLEQRRHFRVLLITFVCQMLFLL